MMEWNTAELSGERRWQTMRRFGQYLTNIPESGQNTSAVTTVNTLKYRRMKGIAVFCRWLPDRHLRKFLANLKSLF